MKRIISVLLALVLLGSFAACDGNLTEIDLKEPIDIPENGIIEKDILDEIKNTNSIATFNGKTADIKYQWLIFGSELNETRDINLSLDIEKSGDGIKVKFAETKDLGFNALVSIHLNEKWTSQRAKAYVDGKEVYTVSVTGTDTAVLNISVNKMFGEIVILPENDYENENSSSVETDDNSDIPEEGHVSDDTSSEIFHESNESNQSNQSNETSCESSEQSQKPENLEKKTYTCTISIECATILNNLSDLESEKLELVPSNGIILSPVKVTFYEGESVFDVLKRVCREKGIHLESSLTPMYNSAYIDGIGNLYEFDCGPLSGWAYRVNGWYPNYSSSRYALKDGDVVEFRYSCDLGKDIGGGNWMDYDA